MFDVGISELLLLAVLVILVVGPKDLPKLMRTVGGYVGQVKRVADDFKSQFNEAIKDSELNEIKQTLDDVKADIGGVTDSVNDPFGEQDHIDFEEHNKKVLEKEKLEKDKRKKKKKSKSKKIKTKKAESKKAIEHETATQKALREAQVGGLEEAPKPGNDVSKKQIAAGDKADDASSVQKSG